MQSMLAENRRLGARRLFWTMIVGFFLGGLLTRLSEHFLPESAARTFLTTSVSASAGPFSMDLIAVSFTLGPVLVYMNVLTLVGIFAVAFIARSWI
jgi:hypothetical protein